MASNNDPFDKQKKKEKSVTCLNLAASLDA